jgi:hypothetical protein
MFKQKIIKPSLIFTVFFVLVTFTISATAFAGKRALCPCFTLDELMAYASADKGAFTKQSYDPENDVYDISRELPLTGEQLSLGCYAKLVEDDEYGSICVVAQAYEFDGSGMEPGFRFRITWIGETGQGQCVGYAPEKPGSVPDSDPLATSADETEACFELLQRASDHDFKKF